MIRHESYLTVRSWLKIRNRNFLKGQIVNCFYLTVLSVYIIRAFSSDGPALTVQVGRTSPGRTSLVQILQYITIILMIINFEDYWILFYWFLSRLLSTSNDVGSLTSLWLWWACMTSLVLKLAIWWNFGASGTTSLNKLFNLSQTDFFDVLAFTENFLSNDMHLGYF